MERTPILSLENQVSVKLIEKPLTVRDLLPPYQYQFQTGEISEESTHMYEDFIDFLVTNEELIFNESMISREDYVKGFQKSLAMIRLWMDSIYLKGGE